MLCLFVGSFARGRQAMLRSRKLLGIRSIFALAILCMLAISS